jgi:hypothetical protein
LEIGCGSEFDEVDKLLQKLWSRFKDWGFAPKLLAIPGNHDLVRPLVDSDPALLTLLHSWQLVQVQEPFWMNRDSPQQRLVSTAFQGFSEWWENTPIPKPEGFNAGLLPGDCSASFEPDGFSVGIVGLNSAYLQLAGGNFERRLHLDARQVHAVCQGHGADWTKRHDACLLLTHHPVQWLTPEAQKHFVDEIHPRPSALLCTCLATCTKQISRRWRTGVATSGGDCRAAHYSVLKTGARNEPSANTATPYAS